MKFLFLLLLSALSAAVEDKVSTNKYKTSRIIKGINSPPTESEAFPDGRIPSHLQYVISLDQAGYMVPGTGLGEGDPEAAVVLSGGTYYTESSLFGWFNTTYQKISRCYGGDWAFFYDEIREFYGEPVFGGETGYEMFSRLNQGPQKYCPLTFEWNSDFTSATITGYMEEVLHALPDMMARNTIVLKIVLRPYWAWKFGLKEVPDGSQFLEMDAKCCPPKVAKCQGAATLGKPKTQCETISMACGEVKPKDFQQCAMWERQNLGLGLISFPSYYVYPIGDKDGRATGFFPHFKATMESMGFYNVFHGVKQA